MFFKFLVNDHGLHRDHKDLYDHKGRWILAVAVFVGWTINYSMEIPRFGPALLQSFIAGGVLAGSRRRGRGRSLRGKD
jgi:hypothetical protein